MMSKDRTTGWWPVYRIPGARVSITSSDQKTGVPMCLETMRMTEPYRVSMEQARRSMIIGPAQRGLPGYSTRIFVTAVRSLAITRQM